MSAPLDDPTVVAVLRFPISVTALEPLMAALEAVYGPGLVIQTGTGGLMVLALPDGRTDW